MRLSHRRQMASLSALQISYFLPFYLAATAPAAPIPVAKFIFARRIPVQLGVVFAHLPTIIGAEGLGDQLVRVTRSGLEQLARKIERILRNQPSPSFDSSIA